MPPSVTIDRTTLVDLLGHATSAARLVGHLDDALAVEPLADHVDAIVHELSELLGNRDVIAAPLPSARASCTISITVDDGTRHDLALSGGAR
jgi:hypothetical protein